MAHRGGLIVVQPEVNAGGDLLQRFAKLQIGGRGIHGIAAEDHQQIDAPVVHVVDQLAHGLHLVDGYRLHGIRVDDGGARVPERRVHGVGERVHGRRLLVTRDDDAGSAVRLQILRRGGDPLVHPGVADGGCAGATADAGVQRPRDRLDLTGACRQTVIRDRTGGRRRGLGDVQPVHLRLRLADAAAVGEVA